MYKVLWTYSILVLLSSSVVTLSNAVVSDDKTQPVFDDCDQQKPKYQVYVSDTGEDNSTCLVRDGNHACQSLQFVMENVKNCTNISITNNQTIKQFKQQFVESVVGIAIVGDSESDMIHVNCTVHDVGIGFNNSRDILIGNIQWNQCGFIHNTSDSQGSALSALFFRGGANVRIINCVFYKSNGTGMSMYNVGGHVTILNTTFEENYPLHEKKTIVCRNIPKDDDIKQAAGVKGGGLYIEHKSTEENSSVATDYLVRNCQFLFNKNIQVERTDEQMFSPVGKGGGMAVLLIGCCHGYNITVDNCNFNNNTAVWGGALTIELSGQNGGNNIAINNTVFVNNTACKSGGGLHTGVENSNNQSHCDQGTDIRVSNSKFETNLALHGAGAYLHSNSPHCMNKNDILEFVTSTWIKNRANYSGDGSAVRLNSSSGTNMTAEFKGCNFSQNYHTMKLTSKFQLDSQGAVYTNKIPIRFSNGPAGSQGTEFTRNYGTALFVCTTSVTMSDNVTFDSNVGFSGGGVSLNDNAVIILNKTELIFRNNSALIHGGAIYAKLSTRFHDNTNTLPCIFHNSSNLLSSKVIFTQNTVASQRCESIYINNPSGCGKSGSWLNDSSVYTYNDSIGFDCVITAPYNIKFHDCKNLSIVNALVEVMVGENFTICPVVSDKFRHHTQTTAHIELANGDSLSSLYVDINSTYRLIGPSTVLMGHHTNNTQFSITGPLPRPNETTNLTILFLVNEDNTFTAHLRVTLLPCKLGFVYDTSTRSCVCDSTGDNKLNIKCPEPGMACVQYGYWYGPIKDNDSTVNVSYPCPFQYCNYDSGNCPNDSCGSLSGYCKLTDNSNDTCRAGRGGPLCGDCTTSKSFTYEAYMCVDTCKPGYTVLLVLGMIGYWVIFIVGLLILLRLNLRIGSGYVYGIMYYFSVIGVVIDEEWPSPTLSTIVRMCFAATQMCPKVLGEIPFCFVGSWSHVTHQFFQYITPLFITIVLLIIIAIGRYCRLPKIISLAEHSAIHAICILMLAAYTAITYTNFRLLNGINFKGSNITYVEIQPSIKYWDTKHHLPYMLVAVLLEAFVVLPFCFLLLFAPCLSSRVNFVKLKIKPILDEFQACYHDNCRWFAGYYLLCRQLVYLVKIVPSAVIAAYLIQYLNVFILIIHASVQPYQDKWLNTIDTLLLMDLVMLSLLYGPTNHFYEFTQISSTSTIGKITTYVLILVPCFYLLAIPIVLVVKRSSKLTSCCVGRRQDSESAVGLSSEQPASLIVDVSNSEMDSSESLGSSFLRDPGEREPLLAYQDNSKYHEEMKRQAEIERHLKSFAVISTPPVISRTSLRSVPSNKKARTN